MSPPTKARAAVYTAPNEPLRIDTFPLPRPASSEVLVRIRCATICGSDLHTYFGRRHSPAPSVLGHEMVGLVAGIGPAGASDWDGVPLQPGDRVTWSMVWSCGRCFYCTRGLRPKCEALRKFGHEALSPGHEFFGGLAEYCLLPEGTAICRIPDGLPDAVASPANCATATVAAVFRYAGNVAGDSVVVYGAGMLGLTACAMASWSGATQVIAIESDPVRAALASRFGATATLDGTLSREALRDEVRRLTEGRGAGFVVELTGSPDAVETGFELLRFGGHFLVAGSTFPARPAALPAEWIVKRLIRISGVYNYEPDDLKRALAFLDACAGRFPFAGLVRGAFSLDEVQQAFACAETERPPRVAVWPAGAETGDSL